MIPLLFISVSIVLFVSALFIGYRFSRIQTHNECPIGIETFDGKNAPYHPSVIYFKDGWNGYRFWMAESPYRPYPFKSLPYRDRWECPSIHASHNGFVWEIPEGGKNPIDDLTEKGIADYDYFSDPELLFKDGILECWYRLSLRNGKDSFSPSSKHILYRKRSINGIHWDEREEMLDISGILGGEIVSPSLLYENGYRMWAVDCAGPETRIVQLFSANGKDWMDLQTCLLIGRPCNPWHIDVNHFDGAYWLVIYEKKQIISLWKSEDGINFKYIAELLNNKHIDGSFDELGYYRASILKVSDNDYRLYFSAISLKSTHIGVMKGSDVLNMRIINCSDKEFCSFIGWLAMYQKKITERINAWINQKR